MKIIKEIVVLSRYDVLDFGGSEILEAPSPWLSRVHPKPTQVCDKANATQSVSES